MKILYLNPNGTMGGAERALLDLMRAVREARPDWSLELVVPADGDFSTAARSNGIDTSILPLPPAVARLGDAGAGGPAGNEISKVALLGRLALSTPQLAAYVKRLKTLLAARDPDVIHSNGFKTHILSAWASPPRSKVLWHVHDYVGSRPLMSRLMRLHARRCGVAIANSHSVARDLDAVCRGKLKIHTVYNAVDLARFRPDGPALDLDAIAGVAPAPAGTVRVGLVATMARWKGHEVFLRALSMLPKDLPVRGYVIGGPIYSTNGSQRSIEELRALAAGLGLNGNAAFTGFVKDSAAAIRSLDVVVHASTDPEPFGLVVAEAMACGKPVVASRSGGVAEIIAENENTLSCPPGDAAAIAGSIARLTLDCGLRQKLGNNGRRWAMERFATCRLGGEVVPIYESLARPTN
ncbi:MAG TPA: glycosyltransferase [Candidatus Binataceae bacterium]|nr:glycosyltransferase [Candidatus Binataceae bacterium]